MHIKYKIPLALLIVIPLVALVCNFGALVSGKQAFWFHVVATLIYVFFWTLFIFLARKSRRCMVYSIVWCGLTTFTAAMVLWLNWCESTLVIIYPAVMLFLTPLYGVKMIFPHGSIYASLTMMVIGLIWTALSTVFFVQLKKHPLYHT